MSLRVWLPLTKDLRNQGLSNVTITNNGATYSSTGGKLGGCYSFDGNDYIRISMPSEMTTLKGTSVAAWVKSTSSTLALGGISNDVNYTVPMCTLYTSGWQFGNDAQNGYRYVSGGTIANTSTWHHVCCTVSDTTITTYLDGVQVTSGTISGVTTFTSANFIEIGCDHPGGDEYLTGSVNDFRVYDHCLSPMEVKQLSQGLVLHYPLNRGGWGQENLYGYGSDLQTTLSGLNNYNNGFSIIEEEGKKCAHVSGALTTTKYLQSKLTYTPSTMEQFTFSAEVKIKNIVRGTKNPMCEFYFSGATIDSAWRGFVVDYIHVDGVKVGATAIGFDRYLTDTNWHKVAVTAHFNYNGTSTIPALYPNIYLRDCTGDLYIRNVKLEKGSIATPWCPNSADELATTMGLNGTTEYDCSGYCNNGNKMTDTMTYTSDTAKYQVSTHFNGTYDGILIENLQLSDIINSAITYAFWIKPEGESGARSVYFGSYSGTSWSVEKTTGNVLRLYWNGSPDETCSGVTITDGIWQHVCITKNGTSDIKVYINGVQKWTSTATHNTLTFPTTYRIGRDTRSNDGTPYKGLISDFRIYATALSASDVKSLYQNCVTIDPDGTIRGQIRS